MIPRARHLLAAAISGALLMLPGFTGSANAAAASQVFHVQLTKTRADVQKVIDYWKPARLKKADSHTPAAPTSAARATPSAGSETAPARPISALPNNPGPVTTAAPPTAHPRQASK